MVTSNKHQSGKEKSAQDADNKGTEGTTTVASVVRTDAAFQQQLLQARATRSQAETARQKIVAEIMEASKELYQKLVDEGEQILTRAKQLEADSELRHLEAQRELEHSNNIRSEADAYRENVISQTQQQAQEMLQQAQSLKAEAVAFREKLLAQVREQAQQELDRAQSERLEADTYREGVIAQAQAQAEEILDQARSAAEQEGKEIVQKYSVEAEKIVAQAELIKAAAQEQLEAQKLYTEVANLETESKEILDRAREQLGRQVPGVELASSELSAGPEASPRGENATQSPGQEFSLDQAPELESFLFPPAAPGTDANSSSSMKDPPWQPDMVPTGQNGTASAKCEGQLPDNELVLGVEINGPCKAYPLQVVTEAKVINDCVNHQDLVVTFGPPSELGMVFKRTVQGRTLTFNAIPGESNGLMLMQDAETGTTWEALTGRAIQGPLTDSQLEHLASEYSFWFAWSDLHPHSEIYSPDQQNSPAKVTN